MLISQTKPALPPAPPAKRVQMTEAELIAAMKADAEAIRKRNLAIIERPVTKEIVPEAQILKAVQENPGIVMNDLAALLDQQNDSLRVRMINMEARGQVRVEKFKHPVSHRMSRRFFPVKNPPKTVLGRRPSPKRDKMVAFIRANPGCTTVDIAQHIGVTVKHAGQALSEVRKVLNLRSERTPGAGNNAPARHWVME